MTVTTDALSAQLRALLPNDVAHDVGPVTTDCHVLDEELGAVARALPVRRREHAAGRRCARAAMRRLGVAPVAVPTGPLGEPTWPQGLAGSITHGRRFAAAVVHRTATPVGALGIDIVDEDDLGAFDGIAGALLSERDARLLRPWPAESRALVAVFGAKETAVKILSPRLRRFVDFREIEVESFTASGLELRGPDGISVRCWSAWTGGVLTSVGRTAPCSTDA